MEIVNPLIEEYLLDHLPSTDPILVEMEERGEEDDFPIVGPLVGRTLALFTHLIKARRIFEFGSGFGYSTWWFAQAAGHNGHIVHTETSEALSEDARTYLTRGKMHDRVLFEVGDAMDIFRQHQEEELWDIVFLDHEKQRYAEALDLVWPRIRPGGLLIADNVLWKGKVLTGDPSEPTRGIKQFTDALLAVPDGQTTILPLRDGVSVTWKTREY